MPSDSYYDALNDLLASEQRCESDAWELRVQQLEEEGLTRSDAQAIADAELNKLTPIDRVSTEDEVLLAARLCRENDMLLIQALRKAGLLK